jgi:hypothetical protein
MLLWFGECAHPSLHHDFCQLTRLLMPGWSLTPGKESCVPWLVAELGNTTTHWCTRAELAAVLGSLARIPALSAAMVRAARRIAVQEQSVLAPAVTACLCPGPPGC